MKVDDGHDDTLAATPRPPSGVDDTLASTPARSAGIAETLVSDTASPPGVAETLASASAPDAGGTFQPRRDLVEAGRYEIRGELARGGMGRVLTAFDRRLGRTVAVKELLAKTSSLAARFRREMEITARLQHPSIVSLYDGGCWPSGEPVYVMERVEGASLDRVIAERTDLGARMSLVPNVIAAIDALAYAHSNNVIHRDLKPANVLVGQFGETVVIDWGLAKDLAAAESDPEADPYRRPEGGDGAETVAGSVVGTPAYMPLEQAHGELLDARADVYALGAMLYHVLAGQPPYVGKTAVEIFEAVLRQPPTPLAEHVPDAPPDLVAIVQRAMARSAEDRYPTAKELADDLRRFQAGQLVGAHRYSRRQLILRWLKRHRIAVAVASVAVVVLAVVAVISVRRIIAEEAVAQAARTSAERHRAKAEQLFDFMLGDLGDKLEPIGKLDLVQDVATQAVAYYDERDGAIPLDANEEKRRALAHHLMGKVQFFTGEHAKAMQSARTARDTLERLLAADPENDDLQRRLGVAHDRVGLFSRESGDHAAARTAYERALALHEGRARRLPHDPLVQRDLADSLLALSKLALATNDVPTAQSTLARAKPIVERRMTEAPQHPSTFELRRTLLNQTAALARKQRDFDGMLAAYREAAALVEHEHLAAPEDKDILSSLVFARLNVGDALRDRKDTEGALVEYRRALASRDLLVQLSPSNLRSLIDRAGLLLRIGMVLEAKDPAQAETMFRQSIEQYRAVLAKDGRATFRYYETFPHQRLGAVLAQRGDAAGALAEQRTVVEIMQRVVAEQPDNLDWKSQLAWGHLDVGGVIWQRDPAGALVEYRAALELFEAMASKGEDDEGFATAHRGIARCLVAAKDLAGARDAYKLARSRFETLIKDQPKEPKWVADRDEIDRELARCCP